MNVRLISIWDTCRSSFWFVPAVMALVAVGMAVGLCQLDEQLDVKNMEISWLVTTAPAARSILSSLAAATIALAGVVFSITVVTLSIASSQYGSRVVRNVMGENIVDVVIGQYIGTSLYYLLVLRTVRDPEVASTGFVPHIATAAGLVMGLISLLMLIGFIQYVATAIQAPKRVEAVAGELNSAVNELFRERNDDRPSGAEDEESIRDEMLDELGNPAFRLESKSEGYIDGINFENLASLAKEYGVAIAVDCKPGDFVTSGKTLMRVWMRSADCNADEIERNLNIRCNADIIVAARRTPRQDVGFAALQLVEIAVRALSPGINDPFTAMNCIDRLGAALGRLAEREPQGMIRRDEDDEARVLVTSVDRFPDVLNDAFDQVRQYGAASTAVSIRMLEALLWINGRASRAAYRAAVRRQAESLRTEFMLQSRPQADLCGFEQRYRLLSPADAEAPPSPIPHNGESSQTTGGPRVAAKGTR